jgi:hypothetical protein
MISMSDLLLPQYLKDLIKQEKELTGETVDSPSDEVKARQLPRPVGHKILCAIPPAGDTFDDSWIAKASLTQRPRCCLLWRWVLTHIKTQIDSPAVLGVKKVILFWFVLIAALDFKFMDAIFA